MILPINMFSINSSQLSTRHPVASAAGEEKGFSLVEVVIAMSVFLVVLLGMSSVFVYSVNYNAGNNTRTQGLMLLQQKMEELRGRKFGETMTHSYLVAGENVELRNSADNKTFSVRTIVDDDPFVPGIQADTSKTLKEITVTVSLDASAPGWQTALPATSILYRTRTYD